ncbi:MAG: hypothetical protein HY238_11810 [Acidobacteria bacterium]|nr:hypothetical protein [Acidobacteriota bacterium]
MIRDLLSLPARQDYYRPERAALVIGTLWEQPPPVQHGGLVFAAWMVRQKDLHMPTSVMGAELCHGMRRLREEFHLNDATAEKIAGLLKEYGDSPEFEPAAGELIARWLRKTDGATPLATWLRSDESAEDEPLRQSAHRAD